MWSETESVSAINQQQLLTQFIETIQKCSHNFPGCVHNDKQFSCNFQASVQRAAHIL